MFTLPNRLWIEIDNVKPENVDKPSRTLIEATQTGVVD